jgi:hypothetical protein
MLSQAIWVEIRNAFVIVREKMEMQTKSMMLVIISHCGTLWDSVPRDWYHNVAHYLTSFHMFFMLG